MTIATLADPAVMLAAVDAILAPRKTQIADPPPYTPDEIGRICEAEFEFLSDVRRLAQDHAE